MKDIKEALEDGSLLIGSRSVMRGIKTGKIKKIFYASNCPKESVKDLNYYTKTSKISAEEFSGDSGKLAQICGKPFNILMVGIKKG
jgi:large subunit ribosomal protein L30e